MKINETALAYFEEPETNSSIYIYNTDASGSNNVSGSGDMSVTLWAFSDGGYEGSVVYAPRSYKSVDVSKPGGYFHAFDLLSEENYEKNLQRKLLCAKNSIRRYVLEYSLHRIFTFNNGDINGGWATRQEAFEDFGIFYKVYKTSLGLGKMLVTAEIGKNGRIHIHCLTQGVEMTGWLDYAKIGEKWTNYLTKRDYVAKGGRHLFNAGNNYCDKLQAYNYFVKALEDSFRDPSLCMKHHYHSYGMTKPRPKEEFRVSTLEEALKFCPTNSDLKFLKSEKGNYYGALWRDRK